MNALEIVRGRVTETNKEVASLESRIGKERSHRKKSRMTMELSHTEKARDFNKALFLIMRGKN